MKIDQVVLDVPSSRMREVSCEPSSDVMLVSVDPSLFSRRDQPS